MITTELAAAVQPSRLRRDVEALCSIGPRSRLHAPAAMQAAEDYVAGELRDAGWVVERQAFTTRWRLGLTDSTTRRAKLFPLRLHRRLSGTNLIARLSDATEPQVVVGAHLDTVQNSPGADDNASGVAAVLELARVLPTVHPQPNVTLAIFDMEELSMVGSAAAAAQLRKHHDVRGMISLESVGYFSSEPNSQRMPLGAGKVLGPAAGELMATGKRGDFVLVAHRRSSAAAAEMWSAAAAGSSPTLPTVLTFDPRPDGVKGLLAGYVRPGYAQLGRSDHASFWNRGIPAMMVTGTASFRNTEYHRPGDTPDRLDYERLAAVTRATALTAADWASDR